jgi:ubiquinone/menaquinone biosynthesis C-methylase UbiE
MSDLINNEEKCYYYRVDEDIENFYRDNYANFIGTGLVGFTARLTHRSMEFGRSKFVNGENLRILEVGAGGGQHVKFCKQNYSEYIMTDLRPKNLPESNGNIFSDRRSISADSLPYPDNNFDRVIATCLLAHIRDPEKALQEWLRVLKVSGVLTIYVPCEPGVLLRLLQFTLTNKKKKKYGITNPSLMHYRDHIHTYVRLKAEIEQSSIKVKNKRFPFPFFSWNFNLWSVFQIVK